MAHRESMKPKVDKKVFKNTAKTTKTVNIKKKPTRGGIRL